MRIGFGYDVHPFIEGRRLVLGGVVVPYALAVEPLAYIAFILIPDEEYACDKSDSISSVPVGQEFACGFLLWYSFAPYTHYKPTSQPPSSLPLFKKAAWSPRPGLNR